ncbi:hypothetical protein ABK040_013807 [Willaertia magna]
MLRQFRKVASKVSASNKKDVLIKRNSNFLITNRKFLSERSFSSTNCSLKQSNIPLRKQASAYYNNFHSVLKTTVINQYKKNTRLFILGVIFLLQIGITIGIIFGYLGMKFSIYLFHKLALDDPQSSFYNPLLLKYLLPIMQSIEGFDRYLKTIATILWIGASYLLVLSTSPYNPYYWFNEKPDKNSEEFLQTKKDLHRTCAERLLALFSENKGVYIKVGQYMASLAGFIPDEYIQVLSVMRDRAPTISYEDVKKVIHQDFGKSIEELFLEFDSVPIASASIAQVHRAILKDGTLVAVKVQYPYVRFFYHGDMKTRLAASRLAIRLYYMQDDYENIDELLALNDEFDRELQEGLSKELDFINEANNSKITARNFSNRDDVHIPKVIDQYTSSRVLTMEFIENACNANDVKKIREMGFNESEVASQIISAFAEQTFQHGFLHSDPHQSNVFVRKNPNNPKKAQIVILDHGLYKSLSDEFRIPYAKFWVSIVLNDKQGIIDYCKSIGISNYRLYSAMIMMQSYDQYGELDASSEKTLNEKDWEMFYTEIEQRRSDFIDIYKNIPKEMMFILRTDNILRSLNRELGAKVNRFSIMARAAARGSSFNKSDLHNWRSRISATYNQIYFEFRLFLLGFQSYIVTNFFKLFGVPRALITNLLDSTKDEKL